MNISSIEKAKRMATECGLHAEFIIHETSGKTTDQASIALGIRPDNILKTLILFASKEQKFIGAIILGSDKLDHKKLASFANVNKLRFATSDEIEKLTGFVIGGVPPLAVTFCDDFYIDTKVVSKTMVVGAGGDEHCGMKLSPNELCNKIELKKCSIAVDSN